MWDIATLANLADIFSGVAVVGGIIFAAVQFREFRAQRREAVTVELMRTFSEPELATAINLIRSLPDGVSGEGVRSRGPEFERAATMLATTYEAIGLLAFRGMTSFSIVRSLTGGIALTTWKKLKPWMELIRAEQNQPSFAEWYQWLAEQLARDSDRHEATPAYTRFANVRPRH